MGKLLNRPLLILNCLKRICHILHENPIRSLIYGLVTLLFVMEVLVYYCNTFSWYQIDCEKSEECTRILLVADPQLIGLHNEPYEFLTPISIWDSDRYLAKTFSYVYQFTKPDVVIFLGDLFDEGSTATSDEFETYYRRLKTVFANPRFQSSNYIWLAGDNDIGGEGNDWLTQNKVKRFENTFQQADIVNVKNLKFCKINPLTASIPKIEDESPSENLNNIIIGLSHLPLLSSQTHFVDKVLHTLRPHLFFTAHTHKLMIIRTGIDNYMEYLINENQKTNQVYDYELDFTNDNIYEFSVPTCSYRMGTNKIGYGFAVTDSKSVRYTVLWSPSRFLQITYYRIILIVVCIYLICLVIRRKSAAFTIKNMQQIM